MSELTMSDIARMRVSAHHLAGNGFDAAEDAARHMLAMQAQDYAGGLWSLGIRTKAATQADVEQAIRERKIVRTWPMRGTLHVLHADDVHWMLDLLAPRATAAAKSRRINLLGLTDDVVAKAERVLRHELKGGRSIQRSDIVGVLNEGIADFEIKNEHSQHLLRNFGERGVICFGPNEGKQPTFVLLDEWVPSGLVKDRGEALGELAKRYFMSHGPASLKDFAGWGMLTMGDAKAGLAFAKSEIAESVIDGVAYYYDPTLRSAETSSTLLLAGFDEYLLGYKNRDAVLRSEHANKIVPGGNGMFLATVVQDGRVIGLWKRRIGKAKVAFDYDYSFDSAVVDTTAAESRYEAFVLNYSL